MPIQLQHLDHIALTVSDLARSIHFYCDVLGLEHRYPGLWGGVPTMLFIGDTGLALFPAAHPQPLPPGRFIVARHFAFRATHTAFAAAQDELRARNIPFEFQDHLISHSIYFDDPDGHHLEITTYEIDNH